MAVVMRAAYEGKRKNYHNARVRAWKDTLYDVVRRINEKIDPIRQNPEKS